MPDDAPPAGLAAAGVLTHGAISLGWGVVLAAVLPRRRTVVWGALAGLVIAGLDLGVLGSPLAPNPCPADGRRRSPITSRSVRSSARWSAGRGGVAERDAFELAHAAADDPIVRPGKDRTRDASESGQPRLAQLERPDESAPHSRTESA